MANHHSVNKNPFHSNVPLFKCVLCGGAFEGYGNNPEPLAKFEDGRACDTCNNDVIIERMLNIQKNNSKKK